MEDYKNTTFPTEIYDYKKNPEFQDVYFIMYVSTCIIIAIGLPLTLVTIFALFSLVRKDHVAPIYVINLFITDFLQLCCLAVTVSKTDFGPAPWFGYFSLLLTSVGFMVCVSLERYLFIAHPLQYSSRRKIKTFVVCVFVWVTPLVLFTLTSYFLIYIIIYVLYTIAAIIAFFILLVIPFPFFIFFLVGTIRALSTSVSVSSDEKRRIVAIQVLLLLIYTLLFLPTLILARLTEYNAKHLILSCLLLELSPLADLSLYIFIRKDTFAKCLAATCCCKKKNNDNPEPAVNVDDQSRPMV